MATGFREPSADFPWVRTAFVTGASRGLGLELTKQLLEAGDKVFAACRGPAAASELLELREPHRGRLDIIELDVVREDSVREAAARILGRVPKIDLLLNVAGTRGNLGPNPAQNLSRFLGEIESESMLAIYAVNAVGPLLLVQALLPLLNGATIVNVTSSMGSNGLMNRGDWYGYRASKAALNIISHGLSFDLVDRNAIVVAIHPGWVKTAMGTDDAPLLLVEAVTSLLKVVNGLTSADSGKFLNWKGEELPW